MCSCVWPEDDEIKHLQVLISLSISWRQLCRVFCTCVCAMVRTDVFNTKVLRSNNLEFSAWILRVVPMFIKVRCPRSPKTCTWVGCTPIKHRMHEKIFHPTDLVLNVLNVVLCMYNFSLEFDSYQIVDHSGLVYGLCRGLKWLYPFTSSYLQTIKNGKNINVAIYFCTFQWTQW